MRLINEALASEPIKNTFRLGWEFITLNRKLTMTLLSTLILLGFLSMLPIVGVVFTVFSSVLSQSIQIYLGRLVYNSENIEAFVSDIEQVEGETIVKHHFSTAMGAYLGWMVIASIFLLLFGVVAGSMGVTESMIYDERALIGILFSMALPLIFIVMILSYLQPLVQSNVILSNGFNEGFLAVLTIFSPDLWKRAFQWSYFRYVSLFGILFLMMIFLFGMVLSQVMQVAVLNILVMVMAFYVMSMILTVSSMMARSTIE